ncbi:ferritin-like domain-containing protein [Paenarthrobacter sp. S56]|uniref:ferritin-like domain-containing protein n=1 Tax=Paenarthrobacter sp. S56 TaxID=3138179 RepID=UPI003219BB91
MDGQASEKKRWRDRLRLLPALVVALIVAGTGIVLVPRDSGVQEPVPFSQSARTAAYGETLALRDSMTLLASPAGSGAAGAELADAVTLLTTHARALLGPSTGSSPAPPAPAPAATPPTASAVVEGLAASGRRRLRDAVEADGGMARLLAAVGTSQLLEAERLGASFKLDLPAPEPAAKASAAATAPQCPSATPTSASATPAGSTRALAEATTVSALAAAVRSEQEAVYVHQVALKRLNDAAAVTAAKNLATHEQLLQQAESLTRLNCGDVPRREAGYRLSAEFSKDPAASLGALESGSLPVYGDLVALSDGPARQWAVDNLLAAARRGLGWGTSVPALPGLELDVGNLPQLPSPSSSRG